MDELDRLVLTESLKSFGVTATDSRDFYFISPHPIDELLAVAAERIPKPVELLVSEEGTAEHFFLAGMNVLPVIFSARFIALSERITRIDNNGYPDELKQQMAESVAYDVIAEFLLTRRNAAAAAISYMKARVTLPSFFFVDTRSLLGAGTDLWSMESRAVDEIYITDFFFGLAHELGHAIQECRTEPGPPWCSDARIAEYVQVAADSSQGDAGITFREVGPSATLAIDRLRHEAGADIEGCLLLARAAHAMIEKHGAAGASLNLTRFFGSILFHYVLLGYLNGCWRTAEFLCLEPGNQKKAVELLQQPLAFAVRQMILQDHLSLIAVEAMGGEGDAEAMFGSGPRDVALIPPEVSAHFKGIWSEVYRALLGISTAINGGLLAAIDYFNRPLPPEELADLASNYATGKQEGLEFAGHRFVDLAKSMHLPDQDLEMLMSMLDIAEES